MAEFKVSYTCDECGADHTPYMVRSGIWARYVPEIGARMRAWKRAGRQGAHPHLYLCVSCLERRMGRKLTAPDLSRK
jgi:hypothetical protein